MSPPTPLPSFLQPPPLSRPHPLQPLSRRHSPPPLPPKPVIQPPRANLQPQPHAPPTPVPPPPTPSPRNLDIVITHSTADFDSLAAAVGLAKLRGPHTLVVTPGGESPSLRRFLALHRQLFQILHPKAVDPARLRWLGVVDTVRKDRLGLAAGWPAMAEQVVVFDHHVGRECDIDNPRLDLVVDNVGAVATLICERLRDAAHVLTPPEATLLALAIHSDTGSLTFEQTTVRDVHALAWLMAQGAIQRSIAEFTHTSLTDDQQAMLSMGLRQLHRNSVNGVEVGSLMLVGRAFMKGMSAVATDLLDIANLDVLLLVYVNCRGRRAKNNKKKRMDDDLCGPDQLKQVSIIGRARARVDGIDFGQLFKDLGGGGHARAASASLKLTEAQAEQLLKQLVHAAQNQIPQPKPVSEVMTKDLITIFAAAPMEQARRLMLVHGHQILPVVDEEDHLQGLITVQDIKVAERKRGMETFQMPVGAWMHQGVVTVQSDTPFYVAEKMVAESTLGMLPIVDNEVLVGAITRMDVLIARRLCPEDFRVHRNGIGHA